MGNAQQFRIFSELVTIEVEPPPERMRLDEILPVLRVLDDQAAAAAVRHNGEPVTCAKGCSACCRIEPVPVTPSEAYALLLLVESLPEPRRATLLARFAERAARLNSAGIADGFLEGFRPLGEEAGWALAKRYIGLSLVCPFLEDDACSIYQARPFACREYFVTTPKELCSQPLSLPVMRVPMLLRAGKADLATTAQFTERASYASYTIPLTLALTYARQHREELQRSYDGDQVFSRSVANFLHLAGIEPGG